VPATPSIGTTTFTTPTDTEIVMTRVVEAPRSLAWDVYTAPAHVQQWMLGPPGWTMPVCEIDLRPGGAFRYVWWREEGDEMEITGVFQEIAAPERIVSTESWGADWPESTNTLVLTEEDGRTTITTTMSYPSMEARDAALGSGMKDGASVTFDRLADYLATLS
jgi:uncharacterized protein YndB with AHSA1/START domain